MLNAEELGNIERCLDEAGVLPGPYRDGYRACMRDALGCFKSRAFEEMVEREFTEAVVKVWAQAMAKDLFAEIERTLEKKP